VPKPILDDGSGGRLHFIGRLLHRPQTVLVRLFHRYLAHDPRWVLLTTRGRRSGLPREVLLPCGRTADAVIVISAYGRRSNWFRNLEQDPGVTVTCAGWVLDGQAEIVDDPDVKRVMLTAYPFIPGFPLVFLPFVLHPLLFPIARPLLLRFVEERPLVVIRRQAANSSQVTRTPSRVGEHMVEPWVRTA
jgi:deazaflavin-dependent oxidoreductase (nitroreductase family)